MKNIIMMLCMLACTMVSSVRAIPLALSFNDSRSIGLIDDGIPSGTVETAGYVNILKGLAAPTPTIQIGTEYYTRTSNDFGVLPTASGAAGDFLKQDNNSTTFDLGIGGYAYLLAKYDAGNAGSYVWYVGGLTGEVSIPQFFNNNQYEVSHTIAFKGSGDIPSVPDTGNTIAFFGAAIVLLGMTRRFLPV